MLKIRLARGGKKGVPSYPIVVAVDRSARDCNYIEKIGFYNPLLKPDNKDYLQIDQEKLQFYYSKGAQPTDIVVKLCKKLGLTIFSHLEKKLSTANEKYKGKSKKEIAKILAEQKAEADKKAKEKAAALKAKATA